MANTKPSARGSDDALRTVDTLAELLDSKFRLPGTNFRFGLDALVGLLPIGGDAVSFLASAGVVLTLVRHGASPMLAFRMLVNVALDAILGSVPVLGDLFDVTFKANNRNVRLMREYYVAGQHRGSVWPVLLATFVALVLLGTLVAWLLYQIGSWLFGLLG